MTILMCGLTLAARRPAAAAEPALAPTARPAATQPAAAAAGEQFFSDPAGAASASVTQILPNGKTNEQLFTHVTAIDLRAQVFLVHWGHGALTLLPARYVGSLTINRQSHAAGAAGAPGAAPAAPPVPPRE